MASMFWKPKPKTRPVTYRVRVGASRFTYSKTDVILSICWVTLDGMANPQLTDAECEVIVRHERPGWEWSGVYQAEVRT